MLSVTAVPHCYIFIIKLHAGSLQASKHSQINNNIYITLVRYFPSWDGWDGHRYVPLSVLTSLMPMLPLEECNSVVHRQCTWPVHRHDRPCTCLASPCTSLASHTRTQPGQSYLFSAWPVLVMSAWPVLVMSVWPVWYILGLVIPVYLRSGQSGIS